MVPVQLTRWRTLLQHFRSYFQPLFLPI